MRIYSVKVFIYCQQLCMRVIQVHLNKLECRGKVHLFLVIQLKLRNLCIK